MRLDSLDIPFEDRELAANLPAAFAQIKQVRDPTLKFDTGVILFGGKFCMGPIPLPFEARCELGLRDGGHTLAIRLAKVKAAFFSGGGEQIVSALTQQMPPQDGLTTEGDTILVQTAKLLTQRGVILGGPIRAIELTPGKLRLRVGG